MMKKFNRIAAFTLAALMAASAFAGCGNQNTQGPDGGQDTTQVQPNLDGVDNGLTMHVEGEVDKTKTLTTLINCDATPAFNGNPFDETAGVNWSVQPFMYDYLAFFAPLPERTYKNSLLESYTFEDKVMTLKLLPGLKWSDGTALDADDLMTHFYCELISNPVWNYMDKLEKVDDLSV